MKLFTKPMLRLQTKITLLVWGVVALSLLVTGVLISEKTASSTHKNLEDQAMNIARVVANSPNVIEAMEGQRNPQEIQKYTSQIQHLTGVAYIVVFDMDAIRLSHPNLNEVGKRFVGGDEGPVLQGKEYTSIAKGTLGMSLRAFTPIFSPEGKQLGAVSVGISLNDVGFQVNRSQTIIYFGIIFGMLVGILSALFLARKIKQIMFGLEPIEIAKLLEERSAMLLSAKEGIVVTDEKNQITFINHEADRLLALAGIPVTIVGKDVDEHIPNLRMHQVLSTGNAELDQEFEINGIYLIVNRVPVRVQGRIAGVIATFRDQTELKQMAEELVGVRIYVEALRTQAHEFMNKLHVISGMLQLQRYKDLFQFVTSISNQHQNELGFMVRRVNDPVLAGFLLGKISYAREAGVNLVISEESYLPVPKNPDIVHELITVFGNLIDNAIESVQNAPVKKVFVNFNYDEGMLSLEVQDSGPGIGDKLKSNIFSKGVTSKGENRGIGLFLVQRSIEKLNGRVHIQSENGIGTTFTVEIPYE